MDALATAILLALAILLVKHALADFFLQTPWQYENKGVYGHPGGLAHAGIHAAMTPAAYLALAPASLGVAAGVAAAEFAFHYHIDWIKEQLNKRFGWTPERREYWWSLGIDQLAHGLTYIAIVAVLLIWT